MIKKLLSSFIPLLLFISCSGILWEGEIRENLTLRIANPLYIPTPAGSSRALALQGKYLYIELALIEDKAAYDADIAKAVSGNGDWIDTAWGGHAIVSLPLTDSDDTIDATFTGVPRDKDLAARVLLDVDASAVQNHLENKTDPICQSYNPDGTNYDEQLWVSLSSDDLNLNLINLALRPKSPVSTIPWSGDSLYMDDYLLTPVTRPQVGETSFFSLNPILSDLKLRDVAYYSMVRLNWTDTALTVPNPVLLYNPWGELIDPAIEELNITSVPFSYRNLQVAPVTLESYNHEDYFIGSTVINDLSPSVWDVSMGLLYDIYSNVFYDSGSLDVQWEAPRGFKDNDLQFKIIYILDPSGITDEGDIDTIAKIEAMGDELNDGWKYHAGAEEGNIIYYANYTSFFPTDLNSWVVILARADADSDPFIYGRSQVSMPM